MTVEHQLSIEFLFQAPGPHPNGMQATADGIWILDQETHQVSLIDYQGAVLRTLQTESDRGSGITFDGATLWLASTYSCEILRVDPDSGKTLARYPTPGAEKTGGHGLEWRDGILWLATPPSATIYQIDVDNGFRVIHECPAPGKRPHGLAWRGEELWCVETNDRAIYQVNPTDGALLQKIAVPESDPEPHGMTLWDNHFYYCDAYDGKICRVSCP